MKRIVWVGALFLGACQFDPGGSSLSGRDAAGVPGSDAHVPVVVDAAALADAATAPRDLVEIPTTQFGMGCVAMHGGALACRPDELPGHDVTLSAYAIDRREVTNALYDACIAAGSCAPVACASGKTGKTGDPTLPVVCVTWFQARDYCTWAGLRLPTEAEWELAARGDGGAPYSWGTDDPTCDRANYAGCGDRLAPVGSHPLGASPYGVQDMAGNAFEWVADWYAADYYTSAPSRDPSGPPDGSERVARGGSYAFDASFLRGSLRSRNDPTLGFEDLGFRCAASR